MSFIVVKKELPRYRVIVSDKAKILAQFIQEFGRIFAELSIEKFVPD